MNILILGDVMGNSGRKDLITSNEYYKKKSNRFFSYKW